MPVFRFFICIFLIGIGNLYGQYGCPGCLVDLPLGLPDDTVFLDDAITGFVNLPYESNVSFRLPKSTTPVSVLDPGVPGGLPIDRITISGLSNLPAGLEWEINQTDFNPSVETDGCVLICGTPEETGYFLVEVNLTAVVFGIQQNSAFSFPIQIYPEPSSDEPVVLFGNQGCDSIEITIVNNVQSNGSTGFSYLWDFGNGMIDSVEFPMNITYGSPGTYFVNFNARIDTAGYTLSALKVLEAACDDFGIPPIISGNPDLYFLLKDPVGNEVFRSDIITDASIPITFPVSFLLTEDNYTLEVWDEDSGLAGGDDLCGRVQLDRAIQDTLTDTNMKVLPTIFHPVLEVSDIDTVVVFQSPSPPDVMPDLIHLNCRDSFFITSDSTNRLEWYWDNLFFAEGETVYVDAPGQYWSILTDTSGLCSVSSDTIIVFDRIIPPMPFFVNDNNLLIVSDSISFGPTIQPNWYVNGDPLPQAISFAWCATTSGNYTVEVVDTLTGCTNSFSANIAYNPNYDCLSSIVSIYTIPFDVYPNPTAGNLFLEGFEINSEDEFYILDPLGKIVFGPNPVKHRQQIDVSNIERGFYFLVIQSGNTRRMARFVKQ